MVLHLNKHDTSMRFGIDKCGVLEMLKESECKGRTNGSGELITETDGDGYKYLGIIERSDICQEEIKRSKTTEYSKRVRLILKSKVNAENLFHAIKWND